MLNPAAPLVVHLDGYFDNPDGDFSIENKVLSCAGAALCAPREQAWEVAENASIVLVRAERVDASGIARLRNCKVLIRYGIGLDKIDITAATAAGIAVCNIPDFCIAEMADHTVTMALALARRIPDYQALARNGTWQLSRAVPLRGFSESLFVTIGFGRIARQVLNRARAFGFQLAAADPFVPDIAIEEEGIEPLTLSDAIRKADVLSLHCPLKVETAGLINTQTLASMKPDAILINASRGDLVDTEALVAALSAGRLGGAGLDVTTPEPLPSAHPLYAMPNVMITPHMAWYSEQAETRLKQLAAEEALRGLLGKPLKNQVNR